MKHEDPGKGTSKYNIDPSGYTHSKRGIKDCVVYFGTPSVNDYLNLDTT